MKFLKQVNFLDFWVPNKDGVFPIDIAGGQGNLNMVNFFLNNYNFHHMSQDFSGNKGAKLTKMQRKNLDLTE